MHCRRMRHQQDHKVLNVVDRACIVYSHDELFTCFTKKVIYFPFPNKAFDVLVIGSLDGLVCASRCTGELVVWNPLTHKYKMVGNPMSEGFFRVCSDVVGLYIDCSNDYKILHVKRRLGVLKVYTYSSRAACWRQINFLEGRLYNMSMFAWSSGTFCGEHLYFTLCAHRFNGRNVVLRFDVNTEEFRDIGVPTVPHDGLYKGNTMVVNGSLVMFVSYGFRSLTVDLWTLRTNTWLKLAGFLPVPNVVLSLWSEVKHVLLKWEWILITDRGRVYRTQTNIPELECFCSLTWCHCLKGTSYVETLVAPGV
jgi:F-box interacting protein